MKVNRFTFGVALILAAFLAIFLGETAAAAQEEVGSTSAILSNANADWSESVLGDVVTDFLRETSGAQVAIVYSGDLSYYLTSGSLTMEDVEAAIPQDPEYVVCDLSPREIMGILENGVSHMTLTEEETIDTTASIWDEFPQVSGLSLRVDSSALAGERILSAELEDGTRLDPENEEIAVQVVLPAAALTEVQLARATEYGGLRTQFLCYLGDNSPLQKPAVTGRIEVLGAHANPLIASGPVLMVMIILLMSAVVSIPAILRQKKNPEAREDVYFTGIWNLRNRKK
jgi:hypothetical protein